MTQDLITLKQQTRSVEANEEVYDALEQALSTQSTQAVVEPTPQLHLLHTHAQEQKRLFHGIEDILEITGHFESRVFN